MSVKIYFDLDGVCYNLYNIPNWEPSLRAEESGVFLHEDANFFTVEELNEAVAPLLELGVQFGVISWLSMQSTPEYEEVCRAEKREWVKKNLPFVTEFNAISYGIPKQNAIRKRAQKMYLIDDNLEICKEWSTDKQRKAYCVDNECRYFDFNLIDALKQIYKELSAELKKEWEGQ